MMVPFNVQMLTMGSIREDPPLSSSSARTDTYMSAGVSSLGSPLQREPSPFEKLYLTDLVRQNIDLQNPLGRQLHLKTAKNLNILAEKGARGPFFGYTGLESPTWTLYTTAIPNGTVLGLTYWGAPHWAGNGNDHYYSWPWQNSKTFKTCAWESMAWNSPNGLVAMTFPACYAVEFWNPKYNQKHAEGVEDIRSERLLVVGPAYLRQYTPLSSGSELCPINRSRVETMIALLVPERFMNCIIKRGVKIDVGMTFLRCLQNLTENERAIELGGQTYCLSVEMVLAEDELTEEMAASPPSSDTAMNLSS